MSMCQPCKETADRTVAEQVERSDPEDFLPVFELPRHPCAYPHSCTCQHGKRPVIKPRSGTR